MTLKRIASLVGALVFERAREAVAGLVDTNCANRDLPPGAAWRAARRQPEPADREHIVRGLRLSTIFAAVPSAAAFPLFHRRGGAAE